MAVTLAKVRLFNLKSLTPGFTATVEISKFEVPTKGVPAEPRDANNVSKASFTVAPVTALSLLIKDAL